MSEENELVTMGEKIISDFQQKLNQGKELAAWRQECILSCEILLYYLKSNPQETEKALLLAGIFRERYEASKPPVIPYWCRRVSEYLSSNQLEQ